MRKQESGRGEEEIGGERGEKRREVGEDVRGGEVDGNGEGEERKGGGHVNTAPCQILD